MTTYKFKAGFTKGGTATIPSAAPTLNIINVVSDALLLTGGTPTASANMPGLYSYSYSGASALDTVGLFHTTDATMDAQDLFATPDIFSLINQVNINLGAGSTSTAITVDDGTNPLDSVDVWVTTDLAGANVIARGYTNASGVVTFMLDAGTVYVWKALARYQFANPSTLTVT